MTFGTFHNPQHRYAAMFFQDSRRSNKQSIRSLNPMSLRGSPREGR
jgi:hypothetical protein